jgi:hypothetical protein
MEEKRTMTQCLRLLFLISMVAAIVIPVRSTATIQSDKSCREHPKLVGKCFSVQGRLAVYNGAPALRILKLGTKRMLGVSEQRFAVEGYRNVPEEVTAKLDQDKLLFGDYTVCPFTRAREKEMQLVCIEKVANLVIKHR